MLTTWSEFWKWPFGRPSLCSVCSIIESGHLFMRRERAVSKQWQNSAPKRPHGWWLNKLKEGERGGGQQKILMLTHSTCKLQIWHGMVCMMLYTGGGVEVTKSNSPPTVRSWIDKPTGTERGLHKLQRCRIESGLGWIQEKSALWFKSTGNIWRQPRFSVKRQDYFPREKRVIFDIQEVYHSHESSIKQHLVCER